MMAYFFGPPRGSNCGLCTDRNCFELHIKSDIGTHQATSDTAILFNDMCQVLRFELFVRDSTCHSRDLAAALSLHRSL